MGWGRTLFENRAGIEGNYYYFKTEKDREEFVSKIKYYSHYGLVMEKKEGVMTHKRTVAEVVLGYKGKTYKLDYDFGYEYPEDVALFQFEENNYSCDCNRSMFIQQYCDESFEEMGCGDEIELVNIYIKHLN